MLQTSNYSLVLSLQFLLLSYDLFVNSFSELLRKAPVIQLNLRWKNSNSFIWTDGLQTLFVFQRLAAVLYCYFYKRTAIRLGDPRFYQDSLWLRKEFMQVRR
ncbi:hypothetical protein H8959_002992 [Pygathrix nigripes]